MNKLLCEIINATLCKRPLNEDVFLRVTEADWQRCFDLALQQNVLAMTFPTMSSLSKEVKPSFTLWSKWMVYAQNVAQQSQYKREVVKKIGSWLAEDGLSTTILKGFTLSILYPDPDLREFGDIDIFSGADYEAVNAVFARHGVRVEGVDGHHAYLKVDGISVEHHFAFHNTKVKNGLVGPEKFLQKIAVTDSQFTAMPGICFPSPAFTALFVGWHAYEHFLQEKIELRHVIDWVLSVKRLNVQEAGIVYSEKANALWGMFCDTLTAIALHELALPEDWFPAPSLCAANQIEKKQEQRVWDDIINAPHTPKSHSSALRRINIAKRIIKNSWKFKEFSNLTSRQLLMKEFVGHFKTPNSKTDSKL